MRGVLAPAQPSAVRRQKRRGREPGGDEGVRGATSGTRPREERAKPSQAEEESVSERGEGCGSARCSASCGGGVVVWVESREEERE